MDDIIEVKVTGAAPRPQIYRVPQRVGLTLDALLQSLNLQPLKTAPRAKDKLEDYQDHEAVPIEIAFPDMADPVMRAARLLRGSRYKMNMTQKQLADALGIRQHHLSEMENGKRPIGKAMAKRLGEVLKTNWKYFV